MKRVIPRRVTGNDFNLFHAIVGTQPILEPRDAERVATEVMATPPEPPIPAPATTVHQKVLALIPAKPKWSPAEVVSQVRSFCHRELRLRIKQPRVSDWLQRVSNQALKRLEEAQARLSSNRGAAARQQREVAPVAPTLMRIPLSAPDAGHQAPHSSHQYRTLTDAQTLAKPAA